MRGYQLNTRLSVEETERFQRVADHYGLNLASTIRMLFKQEERWLGLEPSKKEQRDEVPNVDDGHFVRDVVPGVRGRGTGSRR